jgi:putative nucleotidyltransferase with HDIG domain
MSRKGRIFGGCVTTAGLATLAFGLGSWNSRDILFYCIYLYVALLATGLKVRRSINAGTMPVQFLFILVALKELSVSETLLLACASTVLECDWNIKRRNWLTGLLFEVASVALATTSAYFVYHSALLGRSSFSAPLVLMLAASVYFAVSTLLKAGASVLKEGQQFKEVWQGSYLRSYPYYPVGAAIAGIFSVSDRNFNWQSSIAALPVLYLLHCSYRVHLKSVEEEKKRAEQTASLHLQTVEALATAVEAKDRVTHEHLVRVQVYALELGKALGLSKEELESLRAASILHDIGKVSVPEYILAKPGKLSPEEFERIKIHPAVGAEILARVDFPYPVAPIVRAHHERWNGSGYPDGLKGEGIPLAARVLSVADCLDALTSDRPYRRALPLDRAVETVVAEAGSSFDPRVVRTFEACCREMVQMAERQCSQIENLSSRWKTVPIGAPAAGFQVVRRNGASSPASPEGSSPSASRRQEIQATLELARDLPDSLSLGESLSVLAERLKGLVPYNSMALYIGEKDELIPRYVAGENSRLLSSLRIPKGQGLSGWVADHRKPIVNGNPEVEPGYPDHSNGLRPLRSAIAVPLEGPNGLLGVLSLYQTDENAFAEEHLRIMQEISPRLSLSVGNCLEREEKGGGGDVAVIPPKVAAGESEANGAKIREPN